MQYIYIYIYMYIYILHTLYIYNTCNYTVYSIHQFSRTLMYTGSVVGVHPTGHPSEKMICRVSGVALTRTAVAFARVVFSNDYYKLYKLSLPGKCNIMGLKLTYWESI